MFQTARISSIFFKSRIQRYIHNIRNVGVVAHIDAGKTTTSEQMLFLSGEINSIGRVDDGDTVMDFLPQERERGITISSAAITFQWNGHTVNLVDTPGHVDFTIEVERSARVLDGAILVIDAVAGVQAQTQTVWKQIKKQKVATIAFVNKMDRDGANFNRSLNSVKNKLQTNPVPIQLSVGSEQGFQGTIDLPSLTMYTWGQPNEIISSRSPVKPLVTKLSPSHILYEETMQARKIMMESLAEVDESLMDQYIQLMEANPDDTLESISCQQVREVIRRNCLTNTIVPALCGSALRGKGVELILDAIIQYLPSPADRPPCTLISAEKGKTKLLKHDSKEFCGLVFKVVYDAMRGYLAYVRIYSGSIHSKQVVYNSTRRNKERINQLVKVSADDYVNIDQAHTGDIVCLIGLKSAYSGDTLVLEKSPYESYKLDGLSIPEAVYSVSIEPEKTSQQTDLEKALTIMKVEDPSLIVENNIESGQLLLRGIGELHIEIIVDRLKRQYNIPVYTGRSYVGYRESIKQDIEPINLCHTYERIIGGKRMYARVSLQVIPFLDPALVSDSNNVSTAKPIFEINKDLSKLLTGDEFTGLNDGLQDALLRGPKGFPICGFKVYVISVTKDSDTTSGSIRACISTFADKLLRDPEYSSFLEPIMLTEIDVPTSSLGGVLNDLTVKRRASIIEVTSDETSNSSTTSSGRSVVIAHTPLATMLGYATIIRSMTQGEGLFSMEYLTHKCYDFSMYSEENKH